MSDILSRLVARAHGSSICLARPVRYRFATVQTDIGDWPEFPDDDAGVGQGPITLDRQRAAEPPAFDNSAGLEPHWTRGPIDQPLPDAGSPIGSERPDISAVAAPSEQSGATGPISPMRGGNTCAPPSSAYASSPPVAQRISRPASARDQQSPVDAWPAVESKTRRGEARGAESAIPSTPAQANVPDIGEHGPAMASDSAAIAPTEIGTARVAQRHTKFEQTHNHDAITSQPAIRGTSTTSPPPMPGASVTAAAHADPSSIERMTGLLAERHDLFRRDEPPGAGTQSEPQRSGESQPIVSSSPLSAPDRDSHRVATRTGDTPIPRPANVGHTGRLEDATHAYRASDNDLPSGRTINSEQPSRVVVESAAGKAMPGAVHQSDETAAPRPVASSTITAAHIENLTTPVAQLRTTSAKARGIHITGANTASPTDSVTTPPLHAPGRRAAVRGPNQIHAESFDSSASAMPGPIRAGGPPSINLEFETSETSAVTAVPARFASMPPAAPVRDANRVLSQPGRVDRATSASDNSVHAGPARGALANPGPPVDKAVSRSVEGRSAVSSERMIRPIEPERPIPPRATHVRDALTRGAESGRPGLQKSLPTVAPSVHIDIGRIQIDVPRAQTSPQRVRAEPPALTGKLRGGPDG